MISKTLNSVQLWAVCLAGTIVFSLWGGGTFGGNLSTQTLHDFSVIGLVFAAAGAIAALRSHVPWQLIFGAGAALGLGFWGGNVPSVLHTDTAFFVLAAAQGVVGAISFAFNLEDSADRVKEQRIAYLMTAVAACAAPLIWGESRTEHAFVAIAIVVGVIAYLRSHKFRVPMAVFLALLGGAATVFFSLMHGDDFAAIASFTAFTSLMLYAHATQVNEENRRRRSGSYSLSTR